MPLASGIESGSPKPPASCSGLSPRVSSINAQRVAARLAHDTVNPAPVQRPVDHRAKQRPGGAVGKAADGQLRKPWKELRVTAVAHGEHQRNTLGKQPARDECEDLGGSLVQPL